MTLFVVPWYSAFEWLLLVRGGGRFIKYTLLLSRDDLFDFFVGNLEVQQYNVFLLPTGTT